MSIISIFRGEKDLSCGEIGAVLTEREGGRAFVKRKEGGKWHQHMGEGSHSATLDREGSHGTKS